MLKYPLPYYIRAALNLEPWDEFAKKAIELNKKYLSYYQQTTEGYRCIGTTTKMLVNAVYWSQVKKVYIQGHNLEYSRILVDEAKRMCLKLNLPVENIYPAPQSTKGYGNIFVLQDHYYRKIILSG